MKTETRSRARPGRPATMPGQPAAAAAGAESQPGGIQSLARAFAIMEAVARNRDGANLATISKSVGLHTSTTFHLLKTLAALGYVKQSKESKRYRIGRSLFALAASALDEIEMVNLATPVLEELSRETGESGHFAVRRGDSVIVIARTNGSGAFQLTDRVGVTRPAHCTALGKVILAALDGGQFERFVARTTLAASTPRSITDAERLRREIDEARRSGIAFDDGEFDAEVRCVAVPVHDFTGQVVGALGISGPVWRLTIPAMQSRAAVVQAAAARLSASFGAAAPG
ncbi:MAG TPA: IclR family transcriptional regulator [Candidatus Sulfotelmatobacter sp.]|nr:IclR family transcriptional regulator [Candidatus Sulfotelmatobacter sp.]